MSMPRTRLFFYKSSRDEKNIREHGMWSKSNQSGVMSNQVGNKKTWVPFSWVVYNNTQILHMGMSVKF